MDSDISLFGFRKSVFFRINGRRYANGRTGVRTLEYLYAVYNLRRDATDANWAIRARPFIREIQRLNARPTLCLIVRKTRNPLMRLFAIWMLGRCRGTFGTSSIAKWATDSDFHTRKEAVRALKRKAGWTTLGIVAMEDPDPRIRRLANCQSPKRIEGRIAKFMANVPEESVSESRMPLFISPLLEFGRGKLPKTAFAIRMTLERIRRMVGDPV